METPSKCPNCGVKFSKKVMSFPEDGVELIKRYYDAKSDHYCTKCGRTMYLESLKLLEDEKKPYVEFFKKKLNHILVLTTHSPYKWEYEAMGIVTGQTTTGTGVLSEFTSGWSDLFGGQSKSYNLKLANGEQMAINQMRMKALGMGANAIIAADIDYSEVGGAKGMLMVCASGTAVHLNNLNILGEYKAKELKEISEKAQHMSYFSHFRKYNV